VDDAMMIEKVRSFNRTVTQRVGALNDHYLARGRPLGEARVLWEIGEQGCDVRALRSRLGLDSGYLSRILRSLEAAGLVAVRVNDVDRRVRVATLTAKGRRERALLDQRSDDLARSLLSSLTAAQRQQLVTAMTEVESMLSLAMIEIEVVDPADPLAQRCLDAYAAELDRRFDSGFDPAKSMRADPADMRPPKGLFLMATLGSDPVGCGALKFRGDEPTEVKRMWVSTRARGMGLGRRLLEALENHAAAHGSHTLRLETNRTLVEAIALYRSAGYREVPAFNDEHYADHWFEKPIEATH
jgi:DNA-binding MarR family transcriptional regulator/GNAT superfamily N-acetyltransferase